MTYTTPLGCRSTYVKLTPYHITGLGVPPYLVFRQYFCSFATLYIFDPPQNRVPQTFCINPKYEGFTLYTCQLTSDTLPYMKAHYVVSIATGLPAYRAASEVEALLLAIAYNSYFGAPWFTVTPAS